MNLDSSVSRFPRPPIPPRPLAAPPEVRRARFKRAMDVEYAFFKQKYPPPLLVIALGDSLIALSPGRKTVATKIVQLDK